MKEFDQKINEYFAGKVVRKDLTKLVKGNAIVPTYVLEYLLGQYCATDDEDTINQGVEAVKSIIAKQYKAAKVDPTLMDVIQEQRRWALLSRNLTVMDRSVHAPSKSQILGELPLAACFSRSFAEVRRAG